VERALTRARELCEQLGDSAELFPTLFGLFSMYFLRGELRTASELAEQLLRRAQSVHDPAVLMYAHVALGDASYQMGELLLARENLEKAISLYDLERHRTLTFRFGVNAGVNSLSYVAWTLWLLGYPDQALKRVNEALALARELSQPHSLAFAETCVGVLHLQRREARAARETAERLMALSTEHGFIFWSAVASIERGSAMAEEERSEEGIAQIQEGLAAYRATGTKLGRPYNLSLLAEACMKTGHLDDVLSALTEALAAADENENCECESERHRLKGELLLRRQAQRIGAEQRVLAVHLESSILMLRRLKAAFGGRLRLHESKARNP
jgi:predicted ATPase